MSGSHVSSEKSRSILKFGRKENAVGVKYEHLRAMSCAKHIKRIQEANAKRMEMFKKTRNTFLGMDVDFEPENRKMKSLKKLLSASLEKQSGDNTDVSRPKGERKAFSSVNICDSSNEGIKDAEAFKANNVKYRVQELQMLETRNIDEPSNITASCPNFESSHKSLGDGINEHKFCEKRKILRNEIGDSEREVKTRKNVNKRKTLKSNADHYKSGKKIPIFKVSDKSNKHTNKQPVEEEKRVKKSNLGSRKKTLVYKVSDQSDKKISKQPAETCKKSNLQNRKETLQSKVSDQSRNHTIKQPVEKVSPSMKTFDVKNTKEKKNSQSQKTQEALNVENFVSRSAEIKEKSLNFKPATSLNFRKKTIVPTSLKKPKFRNKAKSQLVKAEKLLQQISQEFQPSNLDNWNINKNNSINASVNLKQPFGTSNVSAKLSPKAEEMQKVLKNKSKISSEMGNQNTDAIENNSFTSTGKTKDLVRTNEISCKPKVVSKREKVPKITKQDDVLPILNVKTCNKTAVPSNFTSNTKKDTLKKENIKNAELPSKSMKLKETKICHEKKLRSKKKNPINVSKIKQSDLVDEEDVISESKIRCENFNISGIEKKSAVMEWLDNMPETAEMMDATENSIQAPYTTFCEKAFDSAENDAYSEGLRDLTDEVQVSKRENILNYTTTEENSPSDDTDDDVPQKEFTTFDAVKNQNQKLNENVHSHTLSKIVHEMCSEVQSKFLRKEELVYETNTSLVNNSPKFISGQRIDEKSRHIEQDATISCDLSFENYKKPETRTKKFKTVQNINKVTILNKPKTFVISDSEQDVSNSNFLQSSTGIIIENTPMKPKGKKGKKIKPPKKKLTVKTTKKSG